MKKACVLVVLAAVAALVLESRVAAAAVSPLHRTRCVAYPGGSGMLADGDFSRATNPPGGLEFSEGSSFAPGWTVMKGNVDFQGTGDGWANAPDGICSVDLDGNTAGGIESRLFQTSATATYTLTFLFSGNGGAGPKIKRMVVGAAGQSESLRWNTANGNDAERGVWRTKTWTFAGTGSPTTIQFISEDRPGSLAGPDIAAVALTQNP